MIKILDSDFSREEWNAVVEHPLQSWEWGETRQKMGVEVLRIGVFLKDKLMNGFQLTVHKVPNTDLKIAYLARSSMPTEEVIDFLYSWAKKNKVFFVKMEPYVENDQDTRNKLQTNPKIQRSTHQLFPDWTMILDITKPEDQLLKEMKSKTRYNIRLAEKKGVTVREETTEKGFEIFAKLYFETMRRQKYFGHNYTYHKGVFDNLKKKMVHVLIASYQNQPMAGYELFLFKDGAYYPYGGSSLENKNIMAPNLLMWEAIKFAKNRGAKYFDMWGASSPDAPVSDIYAGFTRFKEGYGARYLEMLGSYDLVVNPLLYKLYSFAHRARTFILNLISS